MLTFLSVLFGLGAVILFGSLFIKPRPPKPATVIHSRNKSIERINKGECPDCGTEGSLLQGPSGGMSVNVGCQACLHEFNVHMGFGTGAFGVDRSGKMSMSRAGVFGITADEYKDNPNSGLKTA